MWRSQCSHTIAEERLGKITPPSIGNPSSVSSKHQLSYCSLKNKAKQSIQKVNTFIVNSSSSGKSALLASHKSFKSRSYEGTHGVPLHRCSCSTNSHNWWCSVYPRHYHLNLQGHIFSIHLSPNNTSL